MAMEKEYLKNKLKSLPELPGIYKMFDSKGNIIYIGKSKCLKKRVKSYFVGNPKWEKVTKMVSLIHDFEYIVTDTHLEARLLECELIKSRKPVFNSQLKNDQRYVYLKVNSTFNQSPLAVVHEREENTFGPFRSPYTLNDCIDSFRNLYPIVKTDNSYCCQYHLLPVALDNKTFMENRAALLDLFTNKKSLKAFLSDAENKMLEASSLYKFETASMYRDIIRNLNYIKHGINRYEKLRKSKLLLNLPTENGNKLFFISEGNIILTKNCLNPAASCPGETLTDDFIKMGNQMLTQLKTIKKKTSVLPAELHLDVIQKDEKMQMDFHDIVFSEILSLPKEMVTFLKRNS